MKILFVLYDNDSHICFFPLGVAYLAAACRNAGHNVEIYQADTHHWPTEHLTAHIDNGDYDVVGFGTCAGYYQYKKLLEISKAVKNAKKKPFYVLGGHIATPEPEYFLKKTEADAVVMGEGELVLCDLLDALSSSKDLSEVKGIAYLQEEKVYINERKPPCQNLDELPFPAYDLFEMDHYLLYAGISKRRSLRTISMLTGRGCPYFCTFCYRLEKGHRLRSCENIMEEVEMLVKKYDVNYLSFNDELFMASPERAVELSEAFIRSGLNFEWGCAGRLNYAEPEVLATMKKSGCTWIGYGMESMDNEVLRKMNKDLTDEIIVRGVENTTNAGIMVGFNFIFGNLGDTPEALQKSVDFLIKYDRQSQLRTIRPVTPYPGSPLYTMAIKKGLIRDCEDFYESKHTNSDLLTVNLTEMTDDEFYKSLHHANKQLIDNYNVCSQKNVYDALDKLYLERDASFRGFRPV